MRYSRRRTRLLVFVPEDVSIFFLGHIINSLANIDVPKEFHGIFGSKARRKLAMKYHPDKVK